MPAVNRPQIGATETYRDHQISVRLMGPDFLAYVGDIEMSGFYISPNAAVAAGQRYVNEALKAKEKKS